MHKSIMLWYFIFCL